MQTSFRPLPCRQGAAGWKRSGEKFDLTVSSMVVGKRAVHVLVNTDWLICRANSQILRLGILRNFSHMYRGLLSRLLVVMLLVAVVAKPCLGLLVDPVYAAGISVVALDDITVSENDSSTCNEICLSARVEEDDAAALRPKTSWTASGNWAKLKTLSLALRPLVSPADTTDWSPQPRAPKVLRRLAVLSRFLL